MFKGIKFIKSIKRKQKSTEDNIKEKRDKFNKEWDRWGTKTTKVGQKMP